MNATRAIQPPWEQLSLGRHAFIEASAGTGKTYTIEQLVHRILLSPTRNPWHEPIALENILVVTYTEKAAGELRSRVRSRLERTLGAMREPERASEEEGQAAAVILENWPDAARHLERCITRFDRAAIHTIHSFCHRYLRGHAFESGSAMDAELTDEALPADDAVVGMLRGEFRERLWPGGSAEAAARLARTLARWGVSSVEDLRRTAVSLACSVNPAAGDTIQPALTVAPAGATLEEAVAAFRAAFCDIPPERHPFYLSWCGIKQRLGLKRAPPGECADGLRALLAGPGDDTLAAVLAWHALWPDKLRDGRKTLFSYFEGSGRTIDGASDAMDRHHGRTFGEFLVNCAALVRYDFCSAVLRAGEMVREHKEREGAISFGDMIEHMYRAVSGEGQSLLPILRRQFRYGIIDEFQDTNSRQWAIFKRVFVDDNDIGRVPQRCLYVVGDAKQSIFSFQGTDVAVYAAALEELRAHGAESVPLGVNYRSGPAMVGAYNALIGAGDWFDSDHSGIPAYTPVQAAGNARDARCGANCDPEARAPLVLRPLYAESAAQLRIATPARQTDLARWICAQIQYLTTSVGGSTPVQVPDSDAEDGYRAVRRSDICVLVQRHHEADGVMGLLRERGIPYTKQRNTGLFGSDDCLHLVTLLDAVERPTSRAAVHKALLSVFFRYAPEQVAEIADTQDARWHDAAELVRELHRLRQRRQWGRLFAALYHGTDTFAALAGEADARRRIAAHRQLRSYCVRALVDGNMEFGDLVARLRSLHQGSLKENEEEDRFQRETEGDAVVILTMHSVKGLEFPIVFIAGGKGGVGAQQQCLAVRNAAGGTDFWLERGWGKPRYEQYRTGELRRLYYVAVTRAKYQLYLPVWDDPARPDRYDRGSASSVFLSGLCVAAAASAPAGLCVSDMRDSVMLLDRQDSLRASEPETRRERVGSTLARRTAELAPPPAARLTRQRSYSSLVKQTGLLGTRSDPGADDAAEPPARLAYQRPALEPPAGIALGNTVHAILEELDFGQAARAADAGAFAGSPTVREHACACMRRYAIEQRYADTILAWVYHSLTARVSVPGRTPLRLCDLEARRRMSEAEFHVAFGRDGSLLPHPGAALGGWVLGYIDLLFEHEGRYYVLDWKSNRIDTGYTQHDLLRSMVHHGYLLQSRIYALALHRWLRNRLGSDYSVPTHFGGVVYVYVRGTRAGKSDSGLCTIVPDERQLEQRWPDLLRGALATPAALATVLGEGAR